MGLVENAIARRDEADAQGKEVVPESYRGVGKVRISEVLGRIDRCTDAMVEAVFALLCDEGSWIKSAAKRGYLFRDGATTAHIGTHIGIFQRRNMIKLDREGRDYWLKPLWEIGAIEKVTYDSSSGEFIAGHPIAKSPNCAYRLGRTFVDILESKEGDWQCMLDEWIQDDVLRERLAFQAQQSTEALGVVKSSHSELIEACCSTYVPRFLCGYKVVYVDDGDGDRVTDEQADELKKVGLEISLNDSMPDVLLIDEEYDRLWVIEAVTSDGEVDVHKKLSLEDFARRNGKSGVGFTTAYPTWKKVAERQGALKNLASETFLWILEDASRNILIQQ